MSLLDSLSAYFRRPAAETAEEAPEGVCPNCWGLQEFGGEVREIIRDRQVDVNNGEARHAFIQDFVVMHIDGIKLKNNACPRCGKRAGARRP
jgi:hypothetical protein